MYESILSKTMKLWSSNPERLGFSHKVALFGMSTNDMIAIEKICKKYLKKF